MSECVLPKAGIDTTPDGVCRIVPDEIKRPRNPAEFAVVSRESEVRNAEKNPSVERLHGESAALGLRGIVDRTGLRRNLARAQRAERSDDCLSHDSSSLRKSVGIEAGYQ